MVRTDRGSALIIVLILGVIIGIIGLGLDRMADQFVKQAKSRIASKIAQDANIAAFELVNQLWLGGIILGCTTPANLTHWSTNDCATGASKVNLPAQPTTSSTLPFWWSMTFGYQKKTGQPVVAGISLVTCNPSSFTASDFQTMYSSTPRAPRSCLTTQNSPVITQVALVDVATNQLTMDVNTTPPVVR